MSVTVRPMVVDELDIVRELDSSIFADLFTSLSGQKVELPLREPEFFRFWQTADPNGALVALADGEIAGLSFNHARGRSGWIGPLAVCPEHQGRGVGSLLLRRGVEYLRDRGCRQIGLDTFANNPVSVSLYLKHDLAIRGAFVSAQASSSDLLLPDRRDSALRIESITEADLPQIVRIQEQATGFDRTLDFQFCLSWHKASGFKLCADGTLVGCVFCLTKRGRAMASSLYLSESVCLSDGVDALLGACARFGRSTGSPTLTVTATGHDTALLQHLFKHGFRTARAMVRMLSRPPLVSTSSALCTPLASEKG